MYECHAFEDDIDEETIVRIEATECIYANPESTDAKHVDMNFHRNERPRSRRALLFQEMASDVVGDQR